MENEVKSKKANKKAKAAEVEAAAPVETVSESTAMSAEADISKVQAEAAEESHAKDKAGAEEVRKMVMVKPMVNMTLAGGFNMIAGQSIEIPADEYTRLKADQRGQMFED